VRLFYSMKKSSACGEWRDVPYKVKARAKGTKAMMEAHAKKIREKHNLAGGVAAGTSAVCDVGMRSACGTAPAGTTAYDRHFQA